MKNFKGKVIYNPSGKAGEYSCWAANFYNGCSSRCTYCYNRKGITAKVLGGDVPTLKKCLKDENTAFKIFFDEVIKNFSDLKKHGLFFNFVSDPFLKETILLNQVAIQQCVLLGIPVKVLTKQTWWIDDEFTNKTLSIFADKIAFGFTLTGHDELEPGSATNQQRIEAMKKLHDVGFKTWASIEPIIDFPTSFEMIQKTLGYCDLYKIGLQSGKKYSAIELRRVFVDNVISCIDGEAKIYFKDSLLQQAGIKREDLPRNCVTRDFNL